MSWEERWELINPLAFLVFLLCSIWVALSPRASNSDAECELLKACKAGHEASCDELLAALKEEQP